MINKSNQYLCIIDKRRITSDLLQATLPAVPALSVRLYPFECDTHTGYWPARPQAALKRSSIRTEFVFIFPTMCPATTNTFQPLRNSRPNIIPMLPTSVGLAGSSKCQF